MHPDWETYEQEPGWGIVNIDAVRRAMNGDDMAAADLQLGLDKVRVNKNTLIDKLEINLEKHKKEFAEAEEAWKGEVILAMKENLKKAQEDGEFDLYINLDRPQDHSKDYVHVISMLKASVDDTLVISAREFRQYHDDEWAWSDIHKNAVETYSNSRRR